MKKLILNILICFLITGCSGNGSQSNNQPDNPPPIQNKEPAILGECDNSVDYLLITVNGTREKSNVPFTYFVNNFEEGVYFIQVQAVYLNSERDYPVNFELLVTDYDNSMLYELFPKEGFESLFYKNGLILEVVKNRGENDESR